MHDKIVTMAGRLFAEQGYAGTSMRDIAEHLGVTKAALYYHFPSKDELLHAIISQVTERVDELGEAAERGHLGPEDLLASFLDILLEFIPIMASVMQDPSASHERAKRSDLFARQEHFVKMLAGPRAGKTRTLRARCALGALQFSAISAFKAGCREQDHAGAAPPTAPLLTPRERRTVIEAALAALGS